MRYGTGDEIKTPRGQEQSWLDPFRDLGLALTNWTIRYVPDTWVIAIILNVIVFVMALFWGKTTVVGAMTAWGKGFWSLLTLMAEFSFAIMVAYACASAPVMARLFNYLSSRPNPDKPWQAILAMAVFSLFLSWCNWAVSVTMSAMFAPYLAKNNPKTDFRMLVTGAYCGMATLWASGLSSTAPLVVATPDNFLLKAGVITEIITADRTILAPYNFAMILVGFLVVCIMMVLLSPRPEKAYTLTREQAENLIQVAHVTLPENPTFAQKLNWWPGWNIMCGIACIFFMIIAFKQNGVSAWNIDMYNLCFLIVALFLTWRPAFLFDAFKKGISVLGNTRSVPFIRRHLWIGSFYQPWALLNRRFRQHRYTKHIPANHLLVFRSVELFCSLCRCKMVYGSSLYHTCCQGIWDKCGLGDAGLYLGRHVDPPSPAILGNSNS